MVQMYQNLHKLGDNVSKMIKKIKFHRRKLETPFAIVRGYVCLMKLSVIKLEHIMVCMHLYAPNKRIQFVECTL